MRMYSIALWLLVFNLTIGMLNSFSWAGVSMNFQELGNPDYVALKSNTETALTIDTSSPISTFVSILIYTVMSLPKLVEAISFAVAGLPFMVGAIFGAFGAGEAGAIVAGLLIVLTSLIYVIGIIEFVTGKYIGER